jgi:hypothetical protein
VSIEKLKAVHEATHPSKPHRTKTTSAELAGDAGSINETPSLSQPNGATTRKIATNPTHVHLVFRGRSQVRDIASDVHDDVVLRDAHVHRDLFGIADEAAKHVHCVGCGS